MSEAPRSSREKSVPGRLKIAIVVHGRLHAFDLARGLLKRGHDIKLFTNFPKWAVERFGVARRHVCSCWSEGLAFRIFLHMSQRRLCRFPEAGLHTWFGRWAAAHVARGRWDVILCWSGVGEETFRAMQGENTLLICHRTSAHIRTQARLLEEEEKRVGIQQDRPSAWMIAREEREYRLANLVCVPSTFVSQSFKDEGEPLDKLVTIQLGVETQAFRPALQEVEARRARITSGAPLQILNVGTFSFQKGMWDFAEAIKCLGNERFRFRFVGHVAPEAKSLVSDLGQFAEFIAAQPQRKLPEHYRWGDIFVLPTIQDGYGLVLAQAHASALAVATTPNGAGHDLVVEGESGWVLPIRSPNALIDRLRWCDSHRAELAEIVMKIYNDFQPRDWNDVAADFESVCSSKSKDLELGMPVSSGF